MTDKKEHELKENVKKAEEEFKKALIELSGYRLAKLADLETLKRIEQCLIKGGSQ